MPVFPPIQYRGARVVALDSGDIAWVIAATALVMIMTPALGSFYGGLVPGKTPVSTLAHWFPLFAAVALVRAPWGDTLAPGAPLEALNGGLAEFWVNNG